MLLPVVLVLLELVLVLLLVDLVLLSVDLVLLLLWCPISALCAVGGGGPMA